MTLDTDQNTPSSDPICRDDPDIGDDELLWRLVMTTPDSIASGCGRRPQSGSFRDSRMSVDRARLSTIADTLSLQPDRDIAQFSVKNVRELGLSVYADPCFICRGCGSHLGTNRACAKCKSDRNVYHNKSHAIVCPAMKEGVARKFARDQAALLEITPENRKRARDLGPPAIK